MPLYLIYEDIREHGFETLALIMIILKLIDIAPININPWKSLKKALQSFFSGDLGEKLEKLSKTVSEQKAELKEMKQDLNNDRATTARYRIIRYDDEMMNGIVHSDDHKEQIMEDVDTYTAFCEERPYIKNHKGQAAMGRIRDRYNNNLPM